MTLADGMAIRELAVHADARGSLTELFRASTAALENVVQWNLVRSEAPVMRGVHVHLRYDEAYVLIEGRVIVGFRDARPGSPTEGRTGLVELQGRRPTLVTSPPGIAHGLLFLERSVFLAGASREWDPTNELGCHWLDPELGIEWPIRQATLSDRDRDFGPLSAIRDRIPRWAPRAPRAASGAST